MGGWFVAVWRLVLKTRIRTFFLAVVLMGFAGYGFAAEGDISTSGKEIVVKLAKLEEGQNGLNRRIDDQGKRIDDLRSELKGDIQALGNRMNDLKNLMYVVLAGIFALIGFVIWDRRTALSPVVRKAREL
jgi:hypothetical protein